MIRKSNTKKLVTESKYTIRIEDYSASRFPFCIYEENEYLVSFPTKREAQQKLFLLNELYQEAIGYSVKSRESFKSPSRVNFEEDDYIEEEDEVDLEDEDDSDDEEVDVEVTDDEEAPAEEPATEEPAEEAPAEVNEDPDSEAAALEKEALKDAINLAEGFFHAAKVSETGNVKKVFADFINADLKADDAGAKAMKDWADGISADTAKKTELGLALGLSLEDGTVGGKGLNTWLKEVSEKADAVLEVLVLKLDDYLALNPEAETTAEGEGTEEAPAEGEATEELPEDDLFGDTGEEAAAEEAPAEETEDLFA